jgi:hypothetical protein
LPFFDFSFLFTTAYEQLCCYNSAVFRKIIVLATGLACAAYAQENKTPSQPQVKVHMLNVCSPSAEEQQEISSALSRIPRHPAFSPDFEVDRGRSLLDPSANLLVAASNAQISSDVASADFVRIRRDFTGETTYLNVQYSFSRDSKQMVETLVFRVREPKDLLQISIEDSASSVTTAAAMLGAGTPASRIKLERFGKSSVVLARCPGQAGSRPPDQSVYEPLFLSASSILSGYRSLLHAQRTVPEELDRVSNLDKPKPATKNSGSSNHN